MTSRLFLLVVLAFTCVGPLHSQVPTQARINSLLQASSKALDRYQELAPGIRCEAATEKTLRRSCKGVLEMLARDVQDAKEKIARYRKLSAPQPVDLFDIYQVLQDIMTRIDELTFAEDLYGERNRGLFAKAYNNFVKITLWFGGEVRKTMPGGEKPSECGTPSKTATRRSMVNTRVSIPASL
jgi:hypothetical protein